MRTFAERNQRIAMIDGDELDGMSRFRHWYNWKPGMRRYLKRKYQRRWRQQCRGWLRENV